MYDKPPFQKSYAVYAIWMTGGSMVAFCWKHAYDNLQSLLESYLHVVLAYIGVSAALSFIVCYYRCVPCNV